MKELENTIPENDHIIIYRLDETHTDLRVRIENDTVWLSQSQMATLSQKDQSVIARHIRSVFKEGELVENSNMQILHNTFSKFKPTKIYNLDVIISVGYRVKSQRGTQFRIWANRVIKEYLFLRNPQVETWRAAPRLYRRATSLPLRGDNQNHDDQ